MKSREWEYLPSLKVSRMASSMCIIFPFATCTVSIGIRGSVFIPYLTTKFLLTKDPVAPLSSRILVGRPSMGPSNIVRSVLVVSYIMSFRS